MLPTRPILLLATALTANAGDFLLDAFNTDKVRIADTYKAAVQACATKPAKDAANCKKTAEHNRQAELKAASAERDAGLKCRDSCGRVSEVKNEQRDGDGSVAGMAGGGVVGAVVGRKLAGGSSSATKNVATAAGAVGGALLGKKIEQKLTKHAVWTVNYTLYNGKDASAEFSQDPGLKVGDLIEVRDGKPVKR
jgi:outer membrane lipoprotein SlyB